jgi:L-lactate utilization protein LutB
VVVHKKNCSIAEAEVGESLQIQDHPVHIVQPCVKKEAAQKSINFEDLRKQILGWRDGSAVKRVGSQPKI